MASGVPSHADLVYGRAPKAASLGSCEIYSLARRGSVIGLQCITLFRNINRNISLTKGCAKEIISPVGYNNPVRKRGLHVGPSSGACLHYGLPQMMAVRGGLGVLVGGCLGEVCLAFGMAGVVGKFLEA